MAVCRLFRALHLGVAGPNPEGASGRCLIALVIGHDSARPDYPTHSCLNTHLGSSHRA